MRRRSHKPRSAGQHICSHARSSGITLIFHLQRQLLTTSTTSSKRQAVQTSCSSSSASVQQKLDVRTPSEVNGPSTVQFLSWSKLGRCASSLPSRVVRSLSSAGGQDCSSSQRLGGLRKLRCRPYRAPQLNPTGRECTAPAMLPTLVVLLL